MKLLLALTIIMLAATSKAYGQTPSICPPLYNGGAVCQEAKDFRIDKKVQNPKDGSYIDEISQNETLVAPEHTMIFRIVLTNKTDKKLSNISVTDTLPDFVEFVNSDGKTKQNKKQLTYTIATLEAKKTNTMNIEVKVAGKTLLPQDSPVCVANQVEAKMGIFSAQVAKDFVTFCVDPNAQVTSFPISQTQPSFPGQTKGGQVAPTTTPQPTVPSTTKGGQTVYPIPNTNQSPSTGPELFALIGLLPAALGGFILRRKSKGLP